MARGLGEEAAVTATAAEGFVGEGEEGGLAMDGRGSAKVRGGLDPP